MSNPLLSIIIPTYNRPHLLPRAVKSALEQTMDDLEVIVVDDASTEPVNLPEHPRLKIIRLSENKGGAAARNIGARAARGRWISYLDDDDQLLPQMAAVSLEAINNTTLPKPVGILSGIEVVNENGKILSTRLPPTLPRGSHFLLEEIEPGLSFLTKQTLVVEREVLLGIGGWDESFPSRVHTELFLRLNPVCSLLGLPTVTYQLFAHEGTRVSKDPLLRQTSFKQLVHKHESIFVAHPKKFANFILQHARRSDELGQKGIAISSTLWAMQIAPRYTLTQMTLPFLKKLPRKTLEVLTKPKEANGHN